MAPWERGKGVAGVLQRFCSEMVKEKHPDVKVSRLTRDDKLGPKDFKKYRIIAKQVTAWQRETGQTPNVDSSLSYNIVIIRVHSTSHALSCCPVRDVSSIPRWQMRHPYR